MTTRTLALIGLLCLGSAATVYTPPVEARSYVDLDINVAPPAPRYERVVQRRGYVWAPGAWRWEGHRHVWHGGYYVRNRAGHHWIPSHWERRDHGRRGWRYMQGHWSN